MKSKRKVCILGIGNMGEALLKGVLAAGLYRKEEIVVSDISAERLAYIQSTYGVETTKRNAEAAGSSELIIIAVKPGELKSLIEEISPSIDDSKLMISIVGGVPIERMRRWAKKEVHIIRVMSNTPVLVKEGATAISPGPGISDREIKITKKVFDSVGITVVLGEKYLDAVTGLSGSGPAYIFTIIEALSDGGVKVGLPRKEATLLAAQTVLGAAKMVIDTGKHTGVLRDMVTSPAGTTIEGLYGLEVGGIRAALINAVEYATRRAEDLGKGD